MSDSSVDDDLFRDNNCETEKLPKAYDKPPSYVNSYEF